MGSLLFAVVVALLAWMLAEIVTLAFAPLVRRAVRRLRGSPVLPLARWRGEWRGYAVA